MTLLNMKHQLPSRPKYLCLLFFPKLNVTLWLMQQCRTLRHAVVPHCRLWRWFQGISSELQYLSQLRLKDFSFMMVANFLSQGYIVESRWAHGSTHQEVRRVWFGLPGTRDTEGQKIIIWVKSCNKSPAIFSRLHNINQSAVKSVDFSSGNHLVCRTWGPHQATWEPFFN